MESLNLPAPEEARAQEAIRLRQSGRLAEAEALLRDLSDRFPENAMFLALLGTVRLQQGGLEEGVKLLGKFLELSPNQPTALLSRASGLLILGRHQEALEDLDRVITLSPGNAEAHSHRGVALKKLHRLPESLESHDRAIALNPHDAVAYYNRGVALQEHKSWEEALKSYDRAIALQPGYVEAYGNRGVVLLELRRPSEALENFERALSLKPGSAQAHNNRGNALKELGRPEDALAAYSRALVLQPTDAEAHNNRGTVLVELLRMEEALESFDRALALKPAYPAAHWNKALVKLLTGDYAEGWRLYEWRWKGFLPGPFRDYGRPVWLGKEPAAGKTLLVHAEQGYGDSIQFCRYLPLVEKMGAKVVLEAPPSLLPLLSTLAGNITLVPTGASLPAFDLHCPMLSLPLILGTTLETIPAEIPYLSVDAGRRDAWRQRLGPKTALRVGLAWSGWLENRNDRKRSIPVETLAPLLELPFEFHSLQKEYRPADGPWLAEFRIRDHHDELGDFSETAALLLEMDLVLSVDTSVVHLAGALGRPVWVLLPFVPDFRWMLGRSDSPWYPTAVLFRQGAPGDWKAVAGEVARRIQAEFG